MRADQYSNRWRVLIGVRRWNQKSTTQKLVYTKCIEQYGQFLLVKRKFCFLFQQNTYPKTHRNPTIAPVTWNFELSPGLQFGNCEWLIGLKGLTIPTRLKNIDSSFKIFIQDGAQINVVALNETHLVTVKGITDFLNSQIATKTSYYGGNIKFGVSSGSSFATCQVEEEKGYGTGASTVENAGVILR